MSSSRDKMFAIVCGYMSEEPDTAYFLAREESTRFIDDEGNVDIYVLGGSEEYESFSAFDLEDAGIKNWADYDSFREEVLAEDRSLKYDDFVVEGYRDLKDSLEHFLNLWGEKSVSLELD